jgi:hypothetical protein
MNDQMNESMEITTMTNTITTLIEAPKRVRVDSNEEASEPRAIAQGAMVLKGDRVVPIPSIKGVSLTITDDELDFDVDALLKELAKMKLGGRCESELVEITEYDSNGAVSKKEEIVDAPNKLMRPASEWNEEFFKDILRYVDCVPELKVTEQVNNEDAKCTFVHPDGAHVTLELPISRILYVPKYKTLVEAFKFDDDGYEW